MRILNALAAPVRYVASRLAAAYHVAANDAPWTFIFGSGGPTASGIDVNEHDALRIAAVWAAVRILSETVAGLPLGLYRKLPNGGRQRVTSHPVAKLLADRPNPATSWFTFKETLQAHLCTWGNAYAGIEWERGEVVGLWQITPDRVKTMIKQGSCLPTYLVDGKETFGYLEMLHIPALGFDGLVGYSPIRMARESLGLAVAAERFGAAWFGNGSRPSGVLTHPKKLAPETRDKLRKEWEELHRGSGNANRIALLSEGMDFKPFSVPPDDAQFIETRKFSIAEIARWFNIPPHLLRDLDRATNNNIEWQGREFLTYSILPWLCRWVEEFHYKLLYPEEREEYYFRHRVNSLLRADIKTRYGAYAIGRQWGWLSANDVLEEEDEDPIGPAGDIYLTPTNMAPAGEGQWQPVAWAPTVAPRLLSPDGNPIARDSRIQS